MIQEDIKGLATLSYEMCKVDLQASKEGMIAYPKSQEYKSKSISSWTYWHPKRKKSEVVWRTLWLWHH